MPRDLGLIATQTTRRYYEHLGFRPAYGFRRNWEEYDGAEHYESWLGQSGPRGTSENVQD